MSDQRQLMRSAPYFPVPSIEKALEYYELALGFRREYVGGVPAQFVIVSRDGFPLMLRLVPGTEKLVPNEKQGGTWDAFFWVRDVKSLHAEMSIRGAVVVYGPLYQKEYNMDEFAVRDPYGYVLGFGQAR
jgi:hypothetical protein